MQRFARNATFSSLLFIAIAIQVFAQAPTGSVRGLVHDPSEAVISGARVVIINKGTRAERTTTSDSAGEYLFTALPPGEYEIKVEITGFKTQVTTVTLLVGENVRSDFELAIGETAETVVVTGDNSGLNTSDFKIAGVVDRRQIESLPLNGRNFLQLAMLEPGVNVEATAAPGTSANNFFRVSVAGANQ